MATITVRGHGTSSEQPDAVAVAEIDVTFQLEQG